MSKNNSKLSKEEILAKKLRENLQKRKKQAKKRSTAKKLTKGD